MKTKKFAAFMVAAAVLLLWGTRAGAVDWTRLNPDLEGAEPVEGITECMECHEEYIYAFEDTKHAQAFRYTSISEKAGNICEHCHGPSSKHLEEAERIQTSGEPPTIVSFELGYLTPAQENKICMRCHQSGLRMHWKGSAHEISGVSCNECHYVMGRRSSKNLFKYADPKKACYQCHKERRAQMQRSSHMPLREGLMDCADCHNPHGGPGPSLLKEATVNETCYECHYEKRGPFVWEHAPARENCSNCHEPHGSNFDNLLKIKVPQLCQTCHMAGFHPSTLYEGSQLIGGGGTPARQLLGKGCLNCHSQVHGTNHPSGSRLTR